MSDVHTGSEACHINLSLWSWLDNLNSVQLTMFLLQSAVVAKTWIECEFVTKVLNLSMRLSRKHELSMKLSRKSDLSIKLSWNLSLNVINVVFGYEKKIRPFESAKKIIMLWFVPRKNSRPGPKTQAPPPLNIKWTMPYIYMRTWSF